jgi:hypothetical protein
MNVCLQQAQVMVNFPKILMGAAFSRAPQIIHILGQMKVVVPIYHTNARQD